MSLPQGGPPWPTPNRLTSNHIIDSQQDGFTAGGWWEGRWFRDMDFERLWSFGILKDGGEKGVSLSEKWKWKLLSHVQLFAWPHTVHGILQARILEWVAFPCSRGSSQTRDKTQVSNIAGRFFTIWVTREVVCQKRGGSFHPSGRQMLSWPLSQNQPNLIPELPYWSVSPMLQSVTTDKKWRSHKNCILYTNWEEN